MLTNRKILACVASLSVCLASPALAAGVDATKTTCEALKLECLTHVEHAKQYAAAHNASPSPVFSDIVACYQANDKALQTGRWPKMGPMMAQSCSASGG